MSVPRQVEEAAQMAEELMASQYKTDDIEETEEELEPEEEPQPEEESEEQVEETFEDTEDEEEPDTQAEEESYKKKYDSLKGKYDAEVPKLHKELREFKEAVFERLGQQQPQTKEEAKPAEPQVPQKVQEWMEEYGEEYVDGLNAYLDYMLEQRLQSSIQPVQQKVTAVEETQIKTAQSNFAAYLDEKVNGDWHKLWAGEDDGFREFLQQPDPSGLYTYGQLVQLYNDNWDADRLAGVFNAYLGTESVEKPPQSKPPVQEKRIAPNRRSVETPKPKEQARIWTKDTIAQFQQKDRRGGYSPEESQALWNDLLSAPAQNRIRD